MLLNLNQLNLQLTPLLTSCVSLPVRRVGEGKTISNFKDVEFLQWFVGFSDAESSFIINTKNEREVHFTFQITLHIDDVAVLYTIRGKLGIGVVSIKGNTCRCFFLSSNNGKLITCFLQISFTYA